MLLHDMGPKMHDPIPADFIDPGPTTTRISSSYGGGTFVTSTPSAESIAAHQEWRTPPLWGVADSAPYLHDGRAESLAEAIAFHGGEAADSTAAYFQLGTEEQFMVLDFLESLRAPQSP